jgi:site-specific DNA recombinase
MSPTTDTAVGYVRVSSEEQATEGVSLNAQESRIRAYAEMRGLQLVAIYREEGVSGKLPLKTRPEGSKLVDTLTRKRARHVIAVKLDRLFRNAADALSQTEAWDKAKCALHVIDMGGSAIDTASAMGRMFFTMAAAFAEMERNLTSERTRAALRHKRSQREVYCYVTPLGFDRQGDKLIANDSELDTVRRIQQMHERGVSLRRIAAELNATGTPTKRGGRWHLVTVQNVLRIHQP